MTTSPPTALFLMPLLAFAPFFVILFIFLAWLLIDCVIQVFVCLALSSALKRLPAEYRKQDPALVWLLLIPFVRQIWNYFVYPKIAESYKAYYAAQAGLGAGVVSHTPFPLLMSEIQSLESLTLAYAICATVTMIPQLAVCLYFPILAFNIVVLLKIGSIKNKLTVGAKGFPVG